MMVVAIFGLYIYSTAFGRALYEDIRKCSNFKAKTFGFFFTKNYSVTKNIIII